MQGRDVSVSSCISNVSLGKSPSVKKRNRSHTQTHNKNNTKHTTRPEQHHKETTTRTTPSTPHSTTDPPPPHTQQRSTVARRRCLPPPTPVWKSPSVKRSTGHTHTHTDREQHPRHRHTHAHDKNNIPSPQTNTSHKHLTTLEEPLCNKINRSHTTQDDKNNTPNKQPHQRPPPTPHSTTLKGGATTVHTTTHARVEEPLCNKKNRSHTQHHDSRTNYSHEHRASNGATTLNSRSLRRRPQAKKRNRSHTTQDDKNNTANKQPHERTPPTLHSTTLKGGATTVRTTTYARVEETVCEEAYEKA